MKLLNNRLTYRLAILGLSLCMGLSAIALDSYEWIKAQAEQGSKAEQAALGFMYYEGIDVNQNNSKAFEWTKKAAEQGVESAQGLLGKMYYDGIGVDKDNTKAFGIYKKLADNGVSTFQSKIAMMYFDGDGVRQNNVKAFEWARKSVYQTNGDPTPTSLAVLGAFYEFAIGVPQDRHKAKELFVRACDNGSEVGCEGYERLK